MEPIKLLRVTASGRPFGLDVGSVRSIERPNRWARLPWSPDYVRGISEVGGLVVVVIDLAARLGLEPRPPQPTEGVVVIESAEPVALAVEAIEGVELLDLEEAQDLGPEGRRAGARAVAEDGLVLLEGECLVDGRPLAPLDTILSEAAQPAAEEEEG